MLFKTLIIQIRICPAPTFDKLNSNSLLFKRVNSYNWNLINL